MIALDVRDLGGFSTISRAILTFCGEAASVMLWKFHNPPRARGTWEHEEPGEMFPEPEPIEVSWHDLPRDVIESHGNEKIATEYGAYALAIAVADALGFRVVSMAHHGSGADFVLVRRGEPPSDYYKMEVSGMARIGAEAPASRLAEKQEQGRGGDVRRPGVAVVVRFQDVLVLSGAWR